MIATPQPARVPSFRSKSAFLHHMPAARRCWPWVRLLATIGILAALAWRLGASAFVTGLRVITVPSVLAALGIGFFTTLFGAWRWFLVARNLGLRLKLGTAVADCYRSVLLNSVLPAGVLGDVHRAVEHGQRSGDLGRGVRAVVLERFAGQVVLAGIGAVVLVAYPDLVRAVLPGRGRVILLGVLLLAVIALVLWQRSSPSGRRVVRTALSDVRRGLLCRRAWPGVVALSAATVVGHVAMFVFAARIAGSTAPVARLLPIVILTLLVMGLPVNVGGWGPREGFSTFAFGAAGLGATAGLTTAVAYGVLSLSACAPGVLVLLFRRERAGQESRTARYSAKDPTRLASSALPLAAEARDGRPITPEAV